MIYIIGGRGFVGSGFARYCHRRGLPFAIITRENYRRFVGTSCDLLVNANGNSRKYLADRDPVGEFDQSVRSVALSLSSFAARAYVLISTGDVYANPSRPETSEEAADIELGHISRYGLHKYLAERLVIGAHPNWLVIRAGGFVGPGIRKNAVYDILTGGKVWLSPASELQFIHTDHAADIVMGMALAGVSREIVNLVGNGTVRLGELHAETGSAAPFDPAAPTVRYELSLAKLRQLSPVGIPESRDEVARFAAGWPRSAEEDHAPAGNPVPEAAA